MDAESIVALAGANGMKISREAADEIARMLTPAAVRLRQASARTGFDAEPAAFVKALRP
jgi:hypothetical protein